MTKLHALLVGVNNYKSEKLKNYPLRGCLNDVARMSSALQTLFADNLELRTLMEDQATRANIIQSFRTQLIEPARIWNQSGRPTPEPAFLFHFSGHGSLNRDPTLTKPSGFDETIVPFDSRQADVFDIRDWELGALIDELGIHTSCITVILDCCHSGSGTRNSGRMCEPDLRTPPARTLPASSPTQSSGMRCRQETQIADYVVLAACHAKQIAQEYVDNSTGQPLVYGAMTYAVTHTFASLRSTEITCREFYELTRNKVREWFPQQIPQCEGDRDRLLFSSARPGREFPFVVTRMEADHFIIDGGRIHGLMRSQELDVFPAEARTRSTAGDPIARGRIEQADPVSSRCSIVSSTSAVAIGSRLALISGPQNLCALTVADHQKSVLEIRNTEPSNLNGKIQIEVYRVKQQATSGGSPAASNSAKTNTTDYERLSGYTHEEPRIASGTSVCFVVTNNSPQPLYCQILSLGYDGSVSRIWPKLAGEQLLIEPGRSLQTSRFKLMFAPSDKQTTTASEFIKVFASTAQFDVDNLCTGNRSGGETPQMNDDWTTSELGYELYQSV